ncbi:MAG: hypothetical protein LBT38_12335 [Deltaproteobacteria bacterium]|jgi:hypothetical protein|nr:hypothetical protein [Deltaproteobacteria bacterium]
MTWALAHGLTEASDYFKESPLRQASDALKPLVELPLENEKVVKIKAQTINFINDIFCQNEIVTFEKQQSYLHMLCVLVEQVMKTDTNRIRLGSWQNLSDSLVDLIRLLDDQTGDCGVAEGCAWADQLLQEVW